VYKRDYAFRMNVMEEIFGIRSCIEILANDIKVGTRYQQSGHPQNLINYFLLKGLTFQKFLTRLPINSIHFCHLLPHKLTMYTSTTFILEDRITDLQSNPFLLNGNNLIVHLLYRNIYWYWLLCIFKKKLMYHLFVSAAVNEYTT